jgi:hypothetical protein
VNKYAFSGGRDSIELHRKLGANLDVSHFLVILNLLLIVKRVYLVKYAFPRLPELCTVDIYLFEMQHVN